MNVRTRVIPVLLLRDASLVKTVRFGRFSYVGDPCNTVRIFNGGGRRTFLPSTLPPLMTDEHRISAC